MHTYYFEKLEVWQNARVLVKGIYKTTVSFPDNEKFGLVSQIRRASMSVSANIAEGMSRKGPKDKAKFLNIAYSSTIEVINFLILSLDLEYLNENQYKTLREQTEHITNQLQALNKKIMEK